jgi:hypothetical protein
MALGPAGAGLVAYSYDQSNSGAGMIVANAPGSMRKSMTGDPPANWTARHASLSFNQFGPGWPTAGMNEAGLVVTLMWNDAARYAGPGTRPAVMELEFIQYLLDNAATVEEAVALSATLRVTGTIPIHYFVQDTKGNSAVLTPAGEGVEVLTGAALPVPALTNSPYADLLAGLVGFGHFGGSDPLPPTHLADMDDSSLVRFGHAALAQRNLTEGATDGQALAALDTVRNFATQWQILFDPVDGRIAWRTTAAAEIKGVSFSTTDLTCHAMPLAVPVDGGDWMPMNHDWLTATLAEGFKGFTQFKAFGPGLAAEVATGQLAVMHCPG